MRMCVLAALACACGCQRELASIDGIYYAGGARSVHCAANVDSKDNIGNADIDGGLDRALARGEIIELYAHHPGVTVKLSTLEHLLDAAAARGLRFVTYAELSTGTVVGPGVALSFDDTSVAAWTALAPTLDQYGARATFFVSRYPALQPGERAQLKDLADAGHDIEPHSVMHLRAPSYVEDNGLDAYVAREFQASVDALAADGYTAHAYAYPFGARTGELDHALLERVPILRSVVFTYAGIEDPCPL